MEDLVRRCDVIEALTTPEECETDGDKWRMYPPSHAEILNRIEHLPSVPREPVTPTLASKGEVENKAAYALMLQVLMQTFTQEGGYGGIDMCIKCKEKGLDKILDNNGNEINMCDSCLNNMQAVKWDE